MKPKAALATADAAPTARQLFVPITRIDEEKREVWGYATTEDVDSFGTVFPFEASKRAYAQWNDNFERVTDGESKGNLRAMHQKIAAGKVIACEADEEKRAIYIGAHVVDDKEWEKVKKRVYTGFSHGVLQTAPSIMERRNGKLVEIVPAFDVQELSLADNPSCPGAVMTLFRRAADPAPAEAVATVPDPLPTSPAAAPSSAAPIPTSPAAAATEAAPVATTPAAPPAPAPVLDLEAVRRLADAPRAAALPRVAVALKFDVKKFMPGTAVTWARAHDFLVRAVPEPAPNATHIEIEQRNAKDYGELQSVALADGVELVSGTLKTDSAAARFGELLRLVEPEIVRAAQSEEYTILPSLTALAALCQAISSVMYSYPAANGVSEISKQDIASLTLAAESILDFIGSRLGEQLASMTSGAERLAQNEIERFTQLPQVLNRAQLQRLMENDTAKAEVGAMHDLGHALCDATMKMGVACSGGLCAPAETEQERLARVTPAPMARAGFPSPQEVGLRHSTGGRPPAAPVQTSAAAPVAPVTRAAGAPAPEPPSSPTGTDQVLQALAEVKEQVTGLTTRLASVDERVQQVASLPAPIGRPPAGPVDKTLAGAAPSADRAAVSAELLRMAETMPDPALKRELVLRAAAVVAPGAQPAGQGQTRS